MPGGRQCGLPGKACTTTARAPPSESVDSWLSRACTIQVNNLVCVAYSPIRRHELAPRRRKSSINSLPLDASVSDSD